MPWALFNRPSIQLGTLKSYIAAHTNWLTADTTHPFLEVASKLGTELYHWISQNPWVSEALYAPILFPEKAADAEELATRYVKKADKKIQKKFHFTTVTQLLADHLKDWSMRNNWQQYSLVGFSVCFSQLLASLAAAKFIKALYPQAVIVLGGSSCAAEAGRSILKTFEYIDYVIEGEGETALLELCEFVTGHRCSISRSILSSPYNLKHTTLVSNTSSDTQLPSLDSLPVPIYDDYFTDQKKWFSAKPFIPVIPVEFSRGCWWNKCSFCNLNLQWCGYRHKRAAQMVHEIATLAARHDCLDFTFADNMLPPQESLQFFTMTAKLPSDFSFFAEIRVSGMKKSTGHTFTLFRKGGLSTLQVGIEALSNRLLQKMRKGNSVIENIATMRCALENSLELQGNLIIHFPGSSPEDVMESLENLDFVFPFPPLTLASFFLGLDSPVFQNPAVYGIKSIINHGNNSRLFPSDVLRNLMLLVQDYRGDRMQQRKIWKPVIQKVRIWQNYHAQRKTSGLTRPLLFFRDGGNFLLIRQELADGTVLHHRLRNSSRQIYLFCTQVRTATEIIAEFPALPRQKIFSFLADLKKKLLIFSDNDKFLSLAVHYRD
jgi:ribosomal peptide maturation radical SAM protein 1